MAREKAIRAAGRVYEQAVGPAQRARERAEKIGRKWYERVVRDHEEGYCRCAWGAHEHGRMLRDQYVEPARRALRVAQEAADVVYSEAIVAVERGRREAVEAVG